MLYNGTAVMKPSSILACILIALPALAAPLPTFDAVSVRQNTRPDAPQHTNVPLDNGNVYSTVSADDTRSAAGGLFIATRQGLYRYIAFAYKLSGTQELALRFNMFSGLPKSGAPAWVTGGFDTPPEYFDIEARAPANTTIDQMRLMMQSLLADRFHLAVHYTTADAPVFALVLAKPGVTGPNLQAHPGSDACTAPTSNQPSDSAPRPATVSSAIGKLPPLCGVIAHVPSADPGQHYGGRAIPLSLFATSVPTMTGLAATPRPVIDQTGLSGLYDFTLHWIHDTNGGATPATSNESVISDNIASFRGALKSQLGLELKSSHAPISLLIIDHVDRPTEN
jgi:uncharacterized protein (TIGR03435 family)